MVRTPHFHCREHDPWSGTKILRSRGTAKKKRIRMETVLIRAIHSNPEPQMEIIIPRDWGMCESFSLNELSGLPMTMCETGFQVSVPE